MTGNGPQRENEPVAHPRQAPKVIAGACRQYLAGAALSCEGELLFARTGRRFQGSRRSARGGRVRFNEFRKPLRVSTNRW